MSIDFNEAFEFIFKNDYLDLFNFDYWSEDILVQQLSLSMLAQLNDGIGGLLHLGPNVITFRALLHLGPNVITFRTLFHLGPNLITFRTLLHLGQLLHLGLQHSPSYLTNKQGDLSFILHFLKRTLVKKYFFFLKNHPKYLCPFSLVFISPLLNFTYFMSNFGKIYYRLLGKSVSLRLLIFCTY